MYKKIVGFITSRLNHKGRMNRQFVQAFNLNKKYADNNYAKVFFKQITKKFFFGSSSIKYETLIHDAWERIGIDTNNEIITIDNLLFVNDIAFKSEFADIFLSNNIDLNFLKTEDQKVAREILKILNTEGDYENDRVILNKNDIVIDAGANMGIFTLFAAHKKVGKIYAFEPQKNSIEVLKANINNNNLMDLVKIEPYGISETNKICQLYNSGQGRSSGSVVMHLDSNETEEIKCISIDSWVEANNIKKIDFIKADIEGAERDLLKGAMQTLKKFGPKLAICIYHFPDDPVIIPSLIKKANPAYIILKTSHKVFAYIPADFK